MTSRIRCILTGIVFLASLSAAAQPTQETVTFNPAALVTGDPVQEKKQLAKTLQEHRRKNDAHGEAMTLLLIGLNEARLNNLDGARASLNDAVTKMETQNDVIGAWM